MRQPHFIFTFDGVFALVAGLLFITLAPQLTSLLGWPLPASTLTVIGVVLLPWGLFNFWSARSWPLSTAAFMAHVAGFLVGVLGVFVFRRRQQPAWWN